MTIVQDSYLTLVISLFNLTLDNITGETIVMHRADMCKCLD